MTTEQIIEFYRQGLISDEEEARLLSRRIFRRRYLEDFYKPEWVSNCCSARVENGVCQECYEHCEEVQSE